MKIELRPDEQVTITFGATDGKIDVIYGQNHLVVSTDLPDTTGRQGVLYEEILGPTEESAEIVGSETGRYSGDPLHEEVHAVFDQNNQLIDEMIEGMFPDDRGDMN